MRWSKLPTETLWLAVNKAEMESSQVGGICARWSPRAIMWGEMTTREGDSVEQFHQQVIDTHIIKHVGSGVGISTPGFLQE